MGIPLFVLAVLLTRRLADGRIVGQLLAPTVDAVAERLSHLGDGADDADDVLMEV
ncbi:hypothetical protein [Plantactinospora sp. DSM 117369]